MRRAAAALLLAAGTVLTPPSLAWAAQEEGKARPVGIVSRVQGDAKALRAGNRETLGPSDPVAWRDEVSTGEKSRLQVALLDEGLLSLGENTSLTVDELTLGQDDSLLHLSVDGAFRLLSGALHHKDGTTIKTPVATIGIRGTDVWGGPIDGAFGVFVLSGEVEVTTDGGSVILDTPGTGTTISAPGAAPSEPVAWSQEKVTRAVESVTFE